MSALALVTCAGFLGEGEDERYVCRTCLVIDLSAQIGLAPGEEGLELNSHLPDGVALPKLEGEPFLGAFAPRRIVTFDLGVDGLPAGPVVATEPDHGDRSGVGKISYVHVSSPVEPQPSGESTAAVEVTPRFYPPELTGAGEQGQAAEASR